ncbi:RDD family protein [Alteromonas sp. C1M14]|uniref:RDD family protein n=1 Tax=Alteromonas sp. C1M14 TaxID=2841567 RepID=UPI001C0A599A|nr:RDD family protein [Alteromonas sp. C1M14]MBU2978738.1 RDD family protein [Alteromonas sp. C1M14]
MNEPVSATTAEAIQYTGFWLRVVASIIDTIILTIITLPILVAVYGWSYFTNQDMVAGLTDFLLSWVFPLVAIIAFWLYRQATPGKIVISVQIVDAKTGQKPTLPQFLLRYLGYFVALLPLGLGIFWVAWDTKKQGWHDKMANTVVVSTKQKPTTSAS